MRHNSGKTLNPIHSSTGRMPAAPLSLYPGQGLTQLIQLFQIFIPNAEHPALP